MVREGLALTDEQGLEVLSLRTLAARLGVQAPTLNWHVKNKSELLDAVDAEFRRRFPVVAREAVEYFASNSSDHLFEDAVRQLTGMPPRGGAGV